MRKPNPAITKIQVRHRAFTVYEQFRAWLKKNQESCIHEVMETEVMTTAHFCQINAQALRMFVKEGTPGDKRDMLRIKMTGDQRRGCFYEVTFMEYFEDDDGQACYSALTTEEFMINDFYKALECFMQRWESGRPWVASTIRQTPTKELADAYARLGINSFFKTNIVMTPKEWQARLMVNPKKLYVVRPDCGAMITTYPNGDVTILEDDDDAIIPSKKELAAKVGYTGDKNKHGSGSLDHINW